MANDQLELTTKTKLDNMEKDPYKDLVKQCQTEFDIAYDHQNGRTRENLVRLKLYNNQRKNKDSVGDTTMFTIHQTILASLYDDRLMSEWMGREEGDDEIAENLNAMAENDYDDMQKDRIDFTWDWDATAFGRGLIVCDRYYRDPENLIYIPVPKNIDPMVFLRDPRAISFNGFGVDHDGAARFWGREVGMTKHAMQNNVHMFKNVNYSELSYKNHAKELFDEAQRARAAAQGNADSTTKNDEKHLLANAEYILTEWYTHFEINGQIKKVRVWLANKRTKLVGLEVLKNQKMWMAFDRPLYPHSHTWDATSIFDLTEDKQRQRAVAQNLGLRAMKADLYPNYIFDETKIDKKYNFKFAFNKFIPANGAPDGAIAPMRKAPPNMQLLDFIYNSLDMSAQKATATPEIQQGAVSAEKRTLGELNLVAAKTDTRYSLSAKVFGWSERDFWVYGWYGSYKNNFSDIDEKVLRLQGAFGPKWRKLSKDQMIARIDPDCKIESRTVSRAKQLEDRQTLGQYFSMAIQDPTANRRWALKKLGKLNGLQKDEIERLFPPTIDERIAEDQNLFLNQDKQQPVLPEDDHNVHLEVHAKAKPTKATFAHIETHKKALSIKKVRPELFPADQAETAYQTPGSGKITPTMTGNGTQQIAPSETSGQPGIGA